MAKQQDLIKVFRAGSVEATVWTENSQDGHSNRDIEIRVSRSYQDSDGTWRHSNRLKMNDLPRVLLVTEAAYRFLALREINPGRDTAETHQGTHHDHKGV